MKYKFLNHNDFIHDKDEYYNNITCKWVVINNWKKTDGIIKRIINDYKKMNYVRRPIKKKNIG